MHHILRAYDRCSGEILENVGVSLSLLEELQNSGSGENTNGYTPSIVSSSHRGRPNLDVHKEQLEYLLHIGFSCPKIAAIIGVSLSTIRQRMYEFGLSVTSLYSNITDQELDLFVQHIKLNFPNCGYRLMHGHLLQQGHRVSQICVRETTQS